MGGRHGLHVWENSLPVAFETLDTSAVARTLSQIADRPDDLADAYFERLEEVELPAEGDPPGFRVRREEGLAVRLVRGPEAWLAARDTIAPEELADAVRQVARALPPAAYPAPHLAIEPWPALPAPAELADLPLAVSRAIRSRHAAFPLRLAVRRHRRDVQVVSPTLVPAAEHEGFFSLAAELPWGSWGMLAPDVSGALDGSEPSGTARGRARGEEAAVVAVAETAAEALVERFRCRQAPPPAARRAAVVLGPHAAAVFLHEAVAHALEVDTLGLTGRPEGALGLAMGPESLSVLDDPATAPASVRRRSDDEGSPVVRRWLLRQGTVEQPLADRAWSRGSEVLEPGAGRRASRHEPPGPRSSHLELVPGDATDQDLLDGADAGLWVAEADRGRLDPLSGRFVLEVPCARRIRSGGKADPIGRFVLVGTVAELVERVVAIGCEPVATGAGWCAKGGRRLPVWATAPALLLDGVEVAPC